jgi:hypothetical protein
VPATPTSRFSFVASRSSASLTIAYWRYTASVRWPVIFMATECGALPRSRRLSDCPALFATPAQRKIFDAVALALVRAGVSVPSGQLRIFTVRGGEDLPHGQTFRMRDTGKVSVWLDVTAPPREVARACAEQFVHLADIAAGQPCDRGGWERRARRVAGRILMERDVATAIAEAERA